MKSKQYNQSGYTIIEGMVAAIIVAGAVAAITVAIRTADRFKARALHLRGAAVIAQNCSEELRMAALSPVIPGDTTYHTIVHGVAYQCTRRLLDTELSAKSLEYAIEIFTAADSRLVREFRVRQRSAP